jgi:glycosyltransferase involved in cell wall biosynthesis
VRFYIVGGPIYATSGSQFTRDELAARAADLQLTPHMGFVPFQADVVAIYRDLDIAVHASTQPEPFGRTIVEAQCAGLPVIAATTGGAAELFVPEENALGATPGDAGALATAIERLVLDRELAHRLGEAGRRSALERFSRPRLGREIADFYQRLTIAAR